MALSFPPQGFQVIFLLRDSFVGLVFLQLLHFVENRARDFQGYLNETIPMSIDSIHGPIQRRKAISPLLLSSTIQVDL